MEIEQVYQETSIYQDTWQVLAVLGIIIAAAAVVLFGWYVVTYFIERKRSSDVENARAARDLYKMKYSAAMRDNTALTAENIVLRGLNLALDAENKDLHGENHELQEGRTVIHIRGRKIEVL